MRAVTMSGPGGPEVLGWGEVPEPVPGPSEVLIDVAAAGVNRADLLQRQGNYDPPRGASTILGLECSGTIAAVGAGDAGAGWSVGDRVCALLSGGGYAERVVLPAAQLLPVPDGVDLIDAAGLPEVACTVWSNLVMTAGLRAGQTVLLHGGSSGIGTMGIQVAKALGARVAVTASTAEKLQACRSLGADVLINYTEQDFVAEIRSATGGRGADVILDLMGAKYLQRNVSALADGGRLVIIGMQGGRTAELDIAALMGKRAGVIGTTLRSRPAAGPGSKAEVVAAVRDGLWPLVAAGAVRPVIGRRIGMGDAAEAHRALEAGGLIGKVVLTIPH
ncbi:MAG TPA: NAD(P)H-quinone oxidoreductase [Nakamurella sp.]|nr:NAD(P)H-quinone oxidoreductase [Nakamurella sp.]